MAALAGLDNKAKCYIKLSNNMALGRINVADGLITKALRLMNLAVEGRLSLIYQAGSACKEKGGFIISRGGGGVQKVDDADRNFRSVDTEIIYLLLNIFRTPWLFLIWQNARLI